MTDPINETLRFLEVFNVVESYFLPFNIIVHVTALLLILISTPKVATEHKYHLIYVQISLMVLDFALHALMKPVIFFPFMALGFVGIFTKYLNMTPHIQLSLMIALMNNTCISICTMLLHKQNSVVHGGLFKLSRTSIRRINILMLSICIIDATWFYIAGREESSTQEVFTSEFIDQYNIHLYHETVSMKAWFIFLFTILSCYLAAFIGFLIMVAAFSVRVHEQINRETAEVHRIFNTTLVLQMCLMIFVFFLPISICFLAFYFKGIFCIHVLRTCALIPMFHSTLHTLVLITMTRCYRDAIRNVFRKIMDMRVIPHVKSPTIEPNARYL